MKKNFITLSLLSSIIASAQVLIDDTNGQEQTPNANSILELKSANKGLILPRMDIAPTEMEVPGMIYFNTSSNSFMGYTGNEWVSLQPSTSEDTPITKSKVRINEIDYDNPSSDTKEFVEVRALTGYDVSNIEVILYPNGAAKNKTSLSSIDVNTVGDYDYYVINYDENSIQNGPKDALALVEGDSLIEFLSYEGNITAKDGPAKGKVSTNIGKDNDGVDISLQRKDDDSGWKTKKLTKGKPNGI